MADAGSQELLSDHLIAHDKGGYQAQFLRIARGQWAMPIRLKSAKSGHWIKGNHRLGPAVRGMR
jgi:hypothetical protein